MFQHRILQSRRQPQLLLDVGELLGRAAQRRPVLVQPLTVDAPGIVPLPALAQRTRFTVEPNLHVQAAAAREGPAAAVGVSGGRRFEDLSVAPEVGRGLVAGAEQE